MKRTVLGTMLTLILVGMSMLAFNVQPVKAEPTTIIVPDDHEKIQWAIGNASDGNTIFVKTGTYHEHIVVNKSVSLVGENMLNTVLDGSLNGTVLKITANNVNITSFTIQNSGDYDFGICLCNSSNSYVYGNRIANNYDGISLQSSSDSTISGNNITNSGADGIIILFESTNNIIHGNTLSANWAGGIDLQYAKNNTINRNNITGSIRGISLIEASFNNVSENRIANTSFTGILIDRSPNNTFYENAIANSLFGILNYHSNNNTILGNSITNNNYGIRLDDSSNNTLSGDTITNSLWGIQLYGSSNNSIYHNNFVDNTVQVYTEDSVNVWDDGYPSGGNYWSDHNPPDHYAGPHQNYTPLPPYTGSDGIGDFPYVIDENNTDTYPLIYPYVMFPVLM